MKSKAVLISLIALLLIACGGSAEPTQEPTQVPTEVPVPTSTPALTATPTAVSEGTGPEDVLQIVFDAANTGDFEPLANLCDPLGENDGDTQMICDLSTVETDRESFIEYFSQGRISGEAVVNGGSAEVPFLFGPDGDADETMGLIQRDGQWYLLDF